MRSSSCTPELKLPTTETLWYCYQEEQALRKIKIAALAYSKEIMRKPFSLNDCQEAEILLHTAAVEYANLINKHEV